MDGETGGRTIAIVRRRLIPFMFLLYIVAYLDRINIGFAALQMNRDLGFGDAVYGLGAGVFFIGYVLFEVPSNLVLHRVGARRWIARIMITWGAVSASMMFVRTAPAFYAMRFLLGVAEAGFFPGMLLYLTRWFPARERAHAVALFMTATAIAGLIGGPVSGALLQLQGTGGLAGWQWLFLLEGLPAALLGVVVWFYLTEGPETAGWLPPAEREWLVARLGRERELEGTTGCPSVRGVLASGRVWALGVLYFLLVTAMYGVAFWLPQIVRNLSGLGDVGVGLVSAIPYLLAAVCMVPVAKHSDATGERRWHVAAPAAFGAAAMLGTAAVSSPVPGLVLLSCAAIGIWSALGPSWALPMSVLSGRGAAAGLALINSVGNVGGFVGPSLVGLAREMTRSFAGGMLVIAASLVAAAALALALPHEHVPDRGAL
ncbi:MAG: MFS transporter [Acidobacteria bacterium]|nr:MFS transporter [Acidobacteriota bacterium]